MIELAAPYPAIQTVTLLPNPQFGDGEAETCEVASRRAMDGTLYTYVKSKAGRRRLTFPLNLSRMKALELRAFIRSYFATRVRLTDHLGHVWIGHFTSNPFEFTTPKRAGGWPGDEMQTIQLEFEGAKQ